MKIFEQEGYYHICFGINNYVELPSFEMTITEFYYNIPEKKRMNCTHRDEDKKHEKCCRSPKLQQPCVFISPESNTLNRTCYSPDTHAVSHQLQGNGDGNFRCVCGFVCCCCVTAAYPALCVLHIQEKAPKTSTLSLEKLHYAMTTNR